MVEKGMTGATGNVYFGLHEFNDMGFLLHFLRPDNLFVDIGANVGSYTVLASGHVGARSMTFEPIPATFEKLRRNLSINNIEDKVEAFNMGIGSTNDPLYFTSDLDTMNHVSTKPDYEKVLRIESGTVDHMLQHRKPVLIKIDVEGYEHEVIRGATNIMQATTLKAIIIELSDINKSIAYDNKGVHRELKELGFVPYTYDPFERNLLEADSLKNQNTLYIKNFEEVSKTVKDAKPFSVYGMSI